MMVISIFSGSVWQIVSSTSAFGAFILLALVVMSLVSWTIVFQKFRQFRQTAAADETFLYTFRHQHRLTDAASKARLSQHSTLGQIYLSGVEELNDISERRNQGGGLQNQTNSLQESDFEIIEMALEKTLTTEMSRLERTVVFLATTGNSAPFMGLLGTVVGIMDSFWSIGELGSASLAVVAPGIAEALLATIVGLGAAIPAVIAFNWANNHMKKFNDSGHAFILEFLAEARKDTIG